MSKHGSIERVREADAALSEAIEEMNEKKTLMPDSVRRNIGRAANLVATFCAVNKPKEPTMPHPADSWAKVELFRWQYGELPNPEGDDRDLDVNKGIAAMAEAIKKNDPENFPSPAGVCSVLEYIVRTLDKDEKETS